MRRLIARAGVALASVFILAGLGTAVAAPAQAFTTIEYIANCPGNAAWQQLVIRDQRSGAQITVYTNYGQSWKYAPAAGAGSLWYNWVVNKDTEHYSFVGTGTLNWYYHVYCGY